MRIKAIACASATALLAGWMGAAQAGTVTLTPDNSSIQVGQTVTFTYAMDFQDDSTYGGGTDFYYDTSILQFVGWSFDASLDGTDDSALRNNGSDCTQANSDAGCSFDPNDFGPGMGQYNGMAWGNGSGAGMAGPLVIGQMVFQAVGLGAATIFMTANDDGVAGNPGPFYSGNTFTEQNVDWQNGQVTVSQVPLPAAAWLMLGGLGALGGFRRKA